MPDLAFLQHLQQHHEQHPNAMVSMPFQALLQSDALPMTLASANAQFEEAARRIAWNTLNMSATDVPQPGPPHAPQSSAPPPPQLGNEMVVSTIGNTDQGQELLFCLSLILP